MGKIWGGSKFRDGNKRSRGIGVNIYDNSRWGRVELERAGGNVFRLATG